MIEDSIDYADPAARLRNARTHTWMHPLGEVLGALRDAGLALEWLREHPRLPWRMFRSGVRRRRVVDLAGPALAAARLFAGGPQARAGSGRRVTRSLGGSASFLQRRPRKERMAITITTSPTM